MSPPSPFNHFFSQPAKSINDHHILKKKKNTAVASRTRSNASRYDPCRLVQKQDITCIDWFEDATAQCGVPTVIFDIFLLVPDINATAAASNQSVWTELDLRSPHPSKMTRQFVAGD